MKLIAFLKKIYILSKIIWKSKSY